MLGFTFITDSKLSMYREKAIKSENLAKEIEEMQDKADSYKERLSELKSDIASKDKEILSIGKDLSESKEKIDALKENQEKLIKSVKKKTEELDAVKADLDEANYKISNLEEKKNSISFELKKKSNALIEARIRIGDLENEVSVGSKTIQELESKLKLMQVELRGHQIGIIGKDKNDSAEPELDKDEESDKDVAESEKSDVVPETDVIQEEAGDIVEPENEAERVKDAKKKKKKK